METEPARSARRSRGSGGTFRSLRVRNFRLFLAGQLVSTTGTWMQSVAAPFLVLRLTGSGVALGVDAALQFAPILLFGAWAGVIADRFDNRRLQLATQIAYAAMAGSLWALVASRAVRVWMVYALSFGIGLVTSLDMPTRQSFYLDMVGRDDLTNAMSLNTATFTGTRAVGPALAGSLIGLAGLAPVFLINALSYLAVFGALLAMDPAALHPRARVPRRGGQIREGVRYVLRTPAIRGPMLVMAGVFLFSYNFLVLLPLLAVRTFHGDAASYGAMLALFGMGSLASALLLASRVAEPKPDRLAAFALAQGPLSMAVGLAPTRPVAWILMPVLGGVSVAFAITGNSGLQLTAADEMRGRVMALYSVIALGSIPIGGPIAGWVAQHVGTASAGPRIGLVGGGVAAVALGLLGLAMARRERSPA